MTAKKETFEEKCARLGIEIDTESKESTVVFVGGQAAVAAARKIAGKAPTKAKKP